MCQLAGALLFLAAVPSAHAAAIPNYPTFADMGGKPYSVTYDKRSLKIAGEPALFVSGAIHPPRGTPAMWEGWFEKAKQNNLNMIQVYIFWNYHEPVEGEYDWSGRGNLTKFMSMAGDAGIFVNLRIGPYVCAEWTYGGLPAWLGQKPGVAFRQTNAIWQPAMEKWFKVVIDQMAAGKFFATQGGPIVLVQVENELPKTDMRYVAWCGSMAQSALDSAGVKVPITMCNGETANNTINTCNGNDCSGYLEQHGQNGRILIDQPGMWTENEGGFQTWGGAPPPGKEPYFWGRAIADQAMSVMKWFARGGSHMNYYMWTGGNNYGRWTGDAITHMYAVDAIVCPDGHPHEPKFSHSAAMHAALASVASEVAMAPAQLDKGVPVGDKEGPQVVAYEYGSVSFLENDGHVPATVSYKGASFKLPAGSSSLVKAGKELFNSATVATPSKTHRALKPIPLTGRWGQWAEPVLSSDVKPGDYPAASLFDSPSPMEMTNLTHALTTFAFYEAALPADEVAAVVHIKSFEAMGLVAFIDGKELGATHEITHGNGASKTLTIDGEGATDAGQRAGKVLTILSEELGYANYGFTHQILKGIAPGAGSVHVNLKAVAGPWKMRGGLAGEHLKLMDPAASAAAAKWSNVSAGGHGSAATWYKTEFATPAGVSDAPGGSQLLLDAKGLGRGRAWLNGYEIGRYWTLERNDGSACPFGKESCPTQQYYHLPAAWLSSGKPNVLVIFETLGAPSITSVGLATSSMEDGAAVADPTKVVSCEF